MRDVVLGEVSSAMNSRSKYHEVVNKSLKFLSCCERKNDSISVMCATTTLLS